MKALYVLPQGKPNTKTGPVIQQYIGETRKESFASCKDCTLLDSRKCYAQWGTPALAHGSMIRAADRGSREYGLDHALAQAKGKVKYVRFGAIGDPSAVTGLHSHIARIRAAGLGILGYTHFWFTRGSALLGEVMASCDTWAQAKRATGRGWRATLHVTAAWIAEHGAQGTYKGLKYTLCAAQRGKGVTCSNCGLCDATLEAIELILFEEHGPMSEV